MKIDKKDKINFRNTTFAGAYADPNLVPETKAPLVLIVGKSNVGKSSLLNGLTGQKHARVSQTPGKTRLVLLFHVDDKVTLVDLPGYGFAKAGRAEQAIFSKRTEAFVLSRKPDLVLTLLDSRHDPTQLDRHMLAYLQSADIPFLPVLTKADKIKRQALNKQIASLSRSLTQANHLQPIAVSAEKRQGLVELRCAIADYFGLEAVVTD